MKLSENKTNFVPCPEYTGRAVCVDVTPLKRMETEFGAKDKFRIVFEVDTPDADKDGGNFCVWSQPFVPSLHEKSGLRKFLKGWLGRDLTEAERAEFDTETLIGKAAFLVIVHAHEGENTFANIAACTPFKIGEPLTPCGGYIRVQDRKEDDRKGSAAAGPRTQKADSTYKETQAPRGNQAAQAAAAANLGETKVHVGKHAGVELREMGKDSVQKLIAHWLPTAKANPKPTADDRRLIAALDWFIAQESAPAADDIPY